MFNLIVILSSVCTWETPIKSQQNIQSNSTLVFCITSVLRHWCAWCVSKMPSSFLYVLVLLVETHKHSETYQNVFLLRKPQYMRLSFSKFWIKEVLLLLHKQIDKMWYILIDMCLFISLWQEDINTHKMVVEEAFWCPWVVVKCRWRDSEDCYCSSSHPETQLSCMLPSTWLHLCLLWATGIWHPIRLCA